MKEPSYTQDVVKSCFWIHVKMGGVHTDEDPTPHMQQTFLPRLTDVGSTCLTRFYDGIEPPLPHEVIHILFMSVNYCVPSNPQVITLLMLV